MTQATAELGRLPLGLVFMFQSILFVAPIFLSYIAYTRVRTKTKARSIVEDLNQLGYTFESIKELGGNEVREAAVYASYQAAAAPAPDDEDERETTRRDQSGLNVFDYFWPVLYSMGATIVLYSATHPFTITIGFWEGLLEGFINIFGLPPESLTADEFALVRYAGRAMFWGWCGAYLYALNTIFRRYMALDLVPEVDIFVATRMVFAMFIGGIIIVALGVSGGLTGIETEENLTLVSAFVFFVRVRPERGLDWLVSFIGQRIGERFETSNETPLYHVEGLSLWYQGRLKQAGIDNVQSLATGDINRLVIETPFSIGQIVDWVDQAILMIYADELYGKLCAAGVRCASDYLFITATDEGRQTLEQASNNEIAPAKMQMLRHSLQTATNIRHVAYYRWRNSVRVNPDQSLTINDTTQTREMFAVLGRNALVAPSDTES